MFDFPSFPTRLREGQLLQSIYHQHGIGFGYVFWDSMSSFLPRFVSRSPGPAPHLDRLADAHGKRDDVIGFILRDVIASLYGYAAMHVQLPLTEEPFSARAAHEVVLIGVANERRRLRLLLFGGCHGRVLVGNLPLLALLILDHACARV